MLYKIMCNQIHPLHGALPVPYVPVRVAHGNLVAAEPRSTAGLLFPSLSLWNDLGDPVFDGVGPAGFKSRANTFLFA